MNIRKDKRLNLIGLAMRAGKIRCGTFITEKLIRENNAPLVIIASDGSEKQKEKIISLAEKNNTEYITMSTKEELGAILGREEALCMVVTDINFINGIKTLNGGA